MEYPSENKKGRLKTAPRIGTGNGCLIRRKKKYVIAGIKNVPNTVPSLKAISRGMNHERTAITTKGRGK
jgi:hypothetical protein